jgi:hypothetical protein
MQNIMSAAQEFVFTRTYARWIEDKKRRETWSEAVDRYFSFMQKHFYDKVPTKVWTKTKELVLSMDVMPSMRALAAAGPALEKNNLVGYNCTAMAFKDLQSPVELFFILMCGCGAGFSVEEEFISQMPSVAKFTGYHRGTHVVGDSREDWCLALKAGLEVWFAGEDIDFDVSQVRPKGSRLITMGGRASGPEPLQKLLSFVRDIVLKAQGRKLTSIEWLDVGNMIGQAVVVGGVRRSSEISFSDLNDEAMRHAKDFPIPPHRYMSNNSAVYKTKPDMITFIREWGALASSGSGERGICNIEAAKKASPRRNPSDALRFNPCQPAGASLLTPAGIRTMGEMQIGDTVWSGKRWTKITNKVATGVKPVFSYRTKAGVFVGTENHRVVSAGIKIMAQDAESIDIACGELYKKILPICPADVMDGLVVGDGTVHRASNNLVLLLVGAKDLSWLTSEVKDLFKTARPGVGAYEYEINTTITDTELPRTYDQRVPPRFIYGNLNKVCGFLRGLYSANGSICGGRVTLKASSLQIITDVQCMLSALGITSYYTTNKPHNVEFDNGVYTCKQSYDLNITTDRRKFNDLIGFIQPDKQTRLDDCCEIIPSGKRKETYDIVDIVALGEEPVFDITVDDDEHTYWTGGLLVSNCSEIILRADKTQACNLSEVVVRASDKMDDLTEKVKAATWLGAMQSCLTNFPFMRPSFKEMCEEERLLGVSLTGQMDNPKMMTAERLEDLRNLAIKTCRKASKALDINMSVAITTTKPSGTVSQLVNSASGAHPRYAKYYIRRYRISGTDPLFKMMQAQGIKFSPENGERPEDLEQRRKDLISKGRTVEEVRALIPEWNAESVMTWVVSFPEAAPKNAITREQVTAIDQLEWYLKLKQNWVEHNSSITVYVRDNEWLKVGAWVYDHFDDIVGVSFLPYDGGNYSQTPYEEIAKEQYDKMISEMPKIDYAKLADFEVEDSTTGIGAIASCTGTSCELK